MCGDIIESFHRFDYVSCTCGEIGISGGSYAYETSARDYSNFLRVADNDKEIQVKFLDEGEKEWVSEEKEDTVPVKSEQSKTERLDYLIKHMEGLPGDAMTIPLTHYDLLFLLRLMRDES